MFSLQEVYVNAVYADHHPALVGLGSLNHKFWESERVHFDRLRLAFTTSLLAV